jgi:hypothetical protein
MAWGITFGPITIFGWGGSIWSSWIDWYLWSSWLVDGSGNMATWAWVKRLLLSWAWKIGSFLWLVAVWALVYAALMMTLSAWEEEKVKKAKDMVKWTLLWFLGIILASSIIAVVVKFMYLF